jgi:TatA/E family protein of Tat protein translocase
MGEFSPSHLIIVLVIFLLLFGPSRFGDLGASLGKGIRGFKKAMNEPVDVDMVPSKGEIGQIEAAETKEETKSDHIGH